MTRALFMWIENDLVGRVEQDQRGRLSLTYDASWRGRDGAFPVSVSMPLSMVSHPHDAVAAFLWGLLPDNAAILEAWAKRFQVSSQNPFALLEHVGEDCAGAVRMLSSDRAARKSDGAVEWLDEHALAERLRALELDPSVWRAAEDVGQFSLAGAQPKTALFFDGKRWGVPSGRFATTHILKPGIPDRDGHAENEHFCLSLAADLGLPVTQSQILRFEDRVAICVTRYDRIIEGRSVRRIHQEDICQALSVMPAKKYENEGGPGATDVVNLLRERSREPADDVDTFVGALAYGWLIAGTDAHAKNYSVLIGRGGSIRLAPLYDVASFLPYVKHGFQKVKLAMKIGGKYRVHEIGSHAWSKLADELRIDKEALFGRLRGMSTELPDRTSDVLRKAKSSGLKHRVLDELADKIQERARTCARTLPGPNAA